VVPDEFTITTKDGIEIKMITTASGQIPLDFSNTKIIHGGMVQDCNDFKKAASVHDINRIRQQEQYNDGVDARNYATDVGLMKAGMDDID